MFGKKKLGAGLLGLISMLTAGPKVHAALEQDITPAPNNQPERFDLPLLLEAPVLTKIPMSPRLQNALQKAIQDADAEKLKDGIFIIGPNGELEYLGKKSDFDKIRNELLRLKTEKNHAGPGYGKGNGYAPCS